MDFYIMAYIMRKLELNYGFMAWKWETEIFLQVGVISFSFFSFWKWEKVKWSGEEEKSLLTARQLNDHPKALIRQDSDVPLITKTKTKK